MWQPKKGYRAGIDPILLAASVNVSAGQKVLDLGCGVGTASFAIGYRVKNVELYGIEIQKVFADLANLNSKENGIELQICLLYTSPSPRDGLLSRMPSSA